MDDLQTEPPLPASRQVEKVGRMVSATNVVGGGGRAMHAVIEHVSCFTTSKQHFELKTLDAPVIAFGERSPLNFAGKMLNFATGIHVSLFKKCWGTNYPQWSGGDWLTDSSFSPDSTCPKSAVTNVET